MAKKTTKRSGIKVESEKRAAKISLFVEAYIQNGGNGAQAYLAAGYRGKNVNVAAVCAHQLLRKSNVAALLAERRAQLLAASMLTSEEVMQDLANAKRFDPAKLFNEDGSLKRVQDMDLATRSSLSSIEVVEMAGGMKIDAGDGAVSHVPMYTKKIKWLDKNIVREQAHKVFGHYREDNKQKGAAAIAEMMALVDASKFDVRP